MALASIRPAAVAGQFYPRDERVLRTQLAELMSTAVAMEHARWPKAIIVPHAGYIYSDPIAATAYAQLTPMRDRIRRVVMLGPTHRVAVRGFALPAAQAFATPLGEVPLARADWLRLQARDDIVVDDRPHALEHCLEVQLPFLQSLLERFEIVPILVGDARPQAVANLLEDLWGGPETLLLVSSDLSHYLSYHEAQWSDRAAIEEILALRPGLDHEQACGATPINGLLLAAQNHHLHARLLDLRNSGDTAGDRASVVGYASVAFCEADPPSHARH